MARVVNIPEYESLMLPALELLVAEGGELEFEQILAGLITKLAIPAEAISETLPSGRETVFSNRLRWALTYLTTAGQLELVGQNVFTVTPVGFDAIALDKDHMFEVAEGALQGNVSATGAASPGFSEASSPTWKGIGDIAKSLRSPKRPRIDHPVAEDHIRHYFEIAYQDQKTALLAKVHEQSPEFFENLVIDLLLAMGYSQRREDLVSRLGRSGDGGVDGVLLEDELGLSRIYFQAKRYKPNIAVPIASVRDFAGSLESQKASKGLFLTTSRFPKSALEFAASISKRIVLVDGSQLASLMMRHKVGVKLRAVYEVKTIDEAYFTHQSTY